MVVSDSGITRSTIDPNSIEISPLKQSEIPDVLAVIGRGMRDNPLHIAVYGDDPQRRVAMQTRLIGESFKILGLDRHMLVARTPDGTVLGACGMESPDDDKPGALQQVRVLLALLTFGPRTALKIMQWLGAWEKLDLKERHWHVGPLAVDAHLQGQGVGSEIMRVFCEQMDAAGDIAYLETDKPINVTFYERFGFTVVNQQDVVGVPNWFMRRAPQTVTHEP